MSYEIIHNNLINNNIINKIILFLLIILSLPHTLFFDSLKSEEIK